MIKKKQCYIKPGKQDICIVKIFLPGPKVSASYRFHCTHKYIYIYIQLPKAKFETFTALSRTLIRPYHQYSILLIRVLCVSVSREISRTEHRIAVHLSPAQTAFSGEFHKLLDEFLTRTQSGERTVCLSPQFQRATSETTSTT